VLVVEREGGPQLAADLGHEHGTARGTPRVELREPVDPLGIVRRREAERE
jgi:hypothetical protein